MWMTVVALALSAVLVFVRRKPAPDPAPIPRPHVQAGVVGGWLTVCVVLTALAGGAGVLADEFAKWLWFVVGPLVAVAAIGRSRVREMLRSLGVRRSGLARAAALGAAAGLTLVPVAVSSMDAAQQAAWAGLVPRPAQAVVVVALAFVAMLATAATEEVFFRGLLQTRLAAALRSDLGALLIAAVVFGLYHLPYAYFSPQWPTHGNLAWALGSVLTEQAPMGLLFGALWLRHRNLAAPVVAHALLNTLALAPMLQLG